LRSRRITERIPARMIAPRAGVSCSRLSDIERGYISPSPDELRRIADALDGLISARNEVLAFAQRIGWPAEAI
jgi:transcriptional regulator with XRE-family HTH domain